MWMVGGGVGLVGRPSSEAAGEGTVVAPTATVWGEIRRGDGRERERRKNCGCKGEAG